MFSINVSFIICLCKTKNPSFQSVFRILNILKYLPTNTPGQSYHLTHIHAQIRSLPSPPHISKSLQHVGVAQWPRLSGLCPCSSSLVITLIVIGSLPSMCKIYVEGLYLEILALFFCAFSLALIYPSQHDTEVKVSTSC